MESLKSDLQKRYEKSKEPEPLPTKIIASQPQGGKIYPEKVWKA